MATATRNGYHEGDATSLPHAPISQRFSDIPKSIDVPVQDQEDEAVEIDLENLDDPTDLCDLFENERAARTYWMSVSLAYAKQGKVDYAIEILMRGSNAMQNNNPKEKLSMVSCLCWMYLWKSREAPRVAPEGTLVAEAKTKEYYLQLATSTLNEASRINPAFPPLFLARGVLLLLRASLQSPSQAGGRGPVDADKANLLQSALKSFEDAIRVSHGKNMLAVMGKARALYSLGKYPEALAGYQDALQKMPDLVDPDPRIGIGSCFWQLGFKEDARFAWERSLEINPDHKVANILLGLYFLDSSGRLPTNSPEFIRLYKKAMTEFTQKSFKLDKNSPLTCATFANYFLSRKSLSNVDSLAHKAIQYTDVNAIASDGWYLLARKEHYEGDLDKAADYYRRSDDARGGTERGYLPAKFGVAQLSVAKNDLGEAKLLLEKMLQTSKTHEAQTLLGTLYAEEVFANQYAAVKEDKKTEMKKAIAFLEAVRNAWKDPKRNISPDSAVLLNLARLYEADQPDRALQCLQQVEKLEMDQIPDSEHPVDAEDAAGKAALRKLLPPQLLNNIGCFYSLFEKHELASEMFEAALGSCIRIQEHDEESDTDALVTTISFNLGRSYESRGMADQAAEVYEGLLKRHDDYTDAKIRLAYIKLRKYPAKEGPDAVAKLYQENSADLEARALYGWYLGKVHSRKRPANVAEDPELRHYKHTLQNYDKHDRYALVGMGNLYLMSAREMRRTTDQEKQKRSSTYSRAVEFFDKALQLDPRNAYAAQGVAIALEEDKKDHKTALGILNGIRDTIKDPNLFVNIGHIYAETKQWSKAIENYEIALSKEGKVNDAGILACLGRTWLNKGRAGRDLEAYATALECAKKALAVAPEQVHFKFNVAFVQIQLVTTIYSLNETQRSVAKLEEAAAGLEEAIEALDAIAAHPQPPYPKHDIEQRATMAKNTQRKQLERAIASQREYEDKNKEKLAAALEQRQAELRRKQEEREKILERERERQEKIRKEREEIVARDNALAQQRAEAQKSAREAELTTDSETGQKVKRKRKPAKSGGEGRSRQRKKKTAGEDDQSEEEAQPKKKRRLTKKESSKFKSAEHVYDSSEGEDALERADRAIADKSLTPESGIQEDVNANGGGGSEHMDVDEQQSAGNNNNNNVGGDEDNEEEEEENDEEEGVARRQVSKRSRRGRILEESDDEGGEEEGDGPARSPPADTSMAEADEDD